MCGARPHPLCLEPLGDALGSLSCPFLSKWSSHHRLRPFCVGIVFSVQFTSVRSSLWVQTQLGVQVLTDCTLGLGQQQRELTLNGSGQKKAASHWLWLKPILLVRIYNFVIDVIY